MVIPCKGSFDQPPCVEARMWPRKSAFKQTQIRPKRNRTCPLLVFRQKRESNPRQSKQTGWKPTDAPSYTMTTWI